MKKVLVGIAVSVMLSAGVFAADSAPVIKEVKSFPSVDGAGYEAKVKDLTKIKFGDMSGTPAVQAFLGYNDKELYVLMVSAETNPDGIVANYTDLKNDRDEKKLWKDDCVELFLANNSANWNAYYQLIINSKGVVCDIKAEGADATDTSWNADVKIKASMIPKAGGKPAFWIVEIRIPFKDLGTAPKKGEMWKINLARERKEDKSDFSWAKIEGSFHQPELFEKIYFGEAGK
jgi:hypothetical protein